MVQFKISHINLGLASKGYSRATVRIAAQKEAIGIAREISRNHGSELVIYRSNG